MTDLKLPHVGDGSDDVGFLHEQVSALLGHPDDAQQIPPGVSLTPHLSSFVAPESYEQMQPLVFVLHRVRGALEEPAAAVNVLHVIEHDDAPFASSLALHSWTDAVSEHCE